MPLPMTLIAMGLIPAAVLGGVMLHGPKGPDRGAPPDMADGLAFVAAEKAAPAVPPADVLCGATTDARRCRSSD